MRSKPATSDTYARCHAPPGFTLIEVMVVLALIATTFTVGVVYLNGAAEGARLRSDGQRLATFLEIASDRSAVSAQPLWLVYDLERRAVHLARRPAPSPEADRDDWRLTTLHLDRPVRIESVALPGVEPNDEKTMRVRLLGEGLLPDHEVTISDGERRIRCAVSGLDISLAEEQPVDATRP